MAKTVYTDEQKQTALAAYTDHGPAEAERRTGIPRKTIASWARRSGTQMDAPERMQRAVTAAKIKWEQRRLTIADDFGDALQTMLTAAIEASRGDDVRSASRAKDFMVAAAIAYDKAELRVGGPTSRVEHDVSEPGNRLAAVHQLKDAAQKRAAAG